MDCRCITQTQLRQNSRSWLKTKTSHHFINVCRVFGYRRCHDPSSARCPARLARLRQPAPPAFGVVKTIIILQTPALILINPEPLRPCFIWIALFPHGTLMRGGVVLTTANRTYAAHSGAECYLHGHRIYVPDGLNYPRQ